MIVSEMHSNAFQRIAQPNTLTAYWLYHNNIDPGTSTGSAIQRILGDVYLSEIQSTKEAPLNMDNLQRYST